MYFVFDLIFEKEVLEKFLMVEKGVLENYIFINFWKIEVVLMLRIVIFFIYKWVRIDNYEDIFKS